MERDVLKKATAFFAEGPPVKFAWIQTRRLAAIPSGETLYLAPGVTSTSGFYACRQRPGIDARAGGPPPEGAGPGRHSPRASSGTAVPVFTRI